MTPDFVLEQLDEFILKMHDGVAGFTADEVPQLFDIVVLAGRYILKEEMTQKQLLQESSFMFFIPACIEYFLNKRVPIVARRRTIDFVRNTKHVERLGRCLSYDERIHIVAFCASIGFYTFEDVKSLIECVSLPSVSSVSVLPAAT
jgi:hypothetical protein